MNRSVRQELPLMLEALEQRIAPAGVAVNNVSLKFADTTVVPGEAGSVSFTIENTDAAAAYSGKATIRILLSTDTAFGNDFILETLQNVPIKLAADGKLKKTVKFSVCPLELSGHSVPTDGTDYHILVQVLPSGASAGLGASPNTLEYVYQFGDVGDRKGVTLKGLDESGEFYTIGLKGGGTGSVTVGANPAISFTGTTAKSIASSTLLGDRVHQISADSAMKSLLFPGTVVTGDVSLNGGIETLIFGNTGGTGADLVIGGAKPVKSITLGRVTDLNINAAAGITTLQTIDWDAVNADTITAPFITTLKTLGVPKTAVVGDFEAGLSLSGTGAPKGVVLGKAQIAGSLLGGIWDINGAANTTGDIVAEGASGWKLDAEGSVANVILHGSKDVPGSLIGDKTGDGFTLRAQTFGQVLVSGDLDAKIVATGAVAKTGLGIKEITAKSVSGGVIQAVNGGISEITAGEWVNGGSLTAKWVQTLSVDGRKLGESSDFTATVNVAGAVPNKVTFTGYGMGEILVMGTIKDSTWTVPSGIKTLVANSFSGAAMTVGKMGYLANGLKLGVGAIVFENTNITAGQVTKILISNVDKSGSGSTFGIVADSYRIYSRFEAGKIVAGGDGALNIGDVDTAGKYRFHANQSYSA